MLLKSKRTLIYDTFTGSNGTALSSHTPDVKPSGSSWSILSRNCDIQSNRANNAAGGADSLSAWPFCVIDCGAVNYEISSIMARSVGADVDLVVRSSADGTTCYLAIFDSGQSSVYERVSGSYTQRATTATSVFGTGVDVLAKAIVKGSTIIATLNGQAAATYSGATVNPTSTIVGLRGGGGTVNSWQWDNFLVQAI